MSDLADRIEDLREQLAELEEEQSRLWWEEERKRRAASGWMPSPFELAMRELYIGPYKDLLDRKLIFLEGQAGDNITTVLEWSPKSLREENSGDGSAGDPA